LTWKDGFPLGSKSDLEEPCVITFKLELGKTSYYLSWLLRAANPDKPLLSEGTPFFPKTD
jgi:hypothetical protein